MVVVKSKSKHLKKTFSFLPNCPLVLLRQVLKSSVRLTLGLEQL
jgi:hypothetical protein